MSENKKNFFQANAELSVILGLTALCLLIFGQTIRFDFINIDDHAYVYLNETVLSGLNFNSFRWTLTTFHVVNWHPLTWISHMIDVSLFGVNPGAHHATNILLHLINSVLAFVVFRKMTGSFWKSAIVAALFAVHPAHVESVAWISERKDVLSTLFWLLTMFVYLRYAEEEKRRKGEKEIKSVEDNLPAKKSFFSSSPFLLFSFSFLFALGLMAKPMLVTLPFVLLLCDYWTLERLKKLKDLPALIIEKIPLFALVAASSIITFLAQKSGGAVQSLEFIPLETRLVNSALSYAKYVVMLFYPVDLGIFYPFSANVNSIQLAGALVLLIGVTALCIRQRNERKYLLTGWFWFLGTLVPVIGLVQVGGQGLADRYTYVPYFGLFIMLVWGFGEIFARVYLSRKIVAAICACVLLIFSVLAFIQTSYWRNSETLYRHTLSITQDNFFIMNNLCLYYIHHTKTEFAENRCGELLEPNSPSPEAHNTLGILRVEIGKYDEAIRSFQKALELNSDFIIVYSNISVALAKQGKLDEAEKSLQKAFSSDNGNLSREALANSCNILGLSFLEKNQREKAIYYFNKALELQPNYKDATDNLKKAKGEK